MANFKVLPQNSPAEIKEKIKTSVHKASGQAAVWICYLLYTSCQHYHQSACWFQDYKA